MSEINRQSPPGNAEAIVTLLALLVVGSWILAVFFLRPLSGASIATAYSLPFILAGMLVVAIRLVLKGTSRIPVVLGALGVLFIVGGGAFDMIATIIHTPSLHHEANLIGRTLLDSGHAVGFVYAYAFTAQALWLALLCGFWLALLRHRDILVDEIGQQPSLMHFLKSVSGGRRLNWRQWWMPLKLSELPSPYPLLWLIVAILMGGMIDRWYLGLEWFGVLQNGRFIILLTAMAIACVVYQAWLYFACKASADVPLQA